MDLFTYLMAKNGNNTSVHGDLFSYLLGKGQSQTYTISGVTIYIPNAKKLVSFKMTKESTQETTTGKSIFRFANTIRTHNGITGIIDNNILKVSGTASSNYSILTPPNASINLPAGDYTFAINKVLSVALSLNLNTGAQRIEAGDTSVSFTLTETATTFDLRMPTTSGTAYNFEVGLMIANGLNQTYEEYTGGQPSPSPEYPQEVNTVKGYRNLFDKDNLENGYYSSSGVKNSDTGINKMSANFIDMTSNTIISFSANQKIYGLTIYEFDENKSWIKRTMLTQSDSKTILTITTNANTKYVKFGFNYDQATVITQDLIDSLELEVVYGAERLPYVSYGNNYVDVKVVGKNLFDYSSLINGKSINVNTGEIINYPSSSITPYINVKSLTNYTLYRFNQAMRIAFYDKNKNFISTIVQTNDAPFYFTTPNNTAYLILRGSTSYFTETTQLEQNSTYTDFEPYKEINVPIPLNNNELVGLGNYKDELLVDKSGHVFINKKTLKAIYDETVYTIKIDGGSSSDYAQYNITSLLPNCINSSYSKCNYLPYYSGATGALKTQVGFVQGKINFVLSFPTSVANTVNDFKTWISTHNMIVYAPAETPDLIDLNTTVDLKLFKGVNNISNSEDGYMTIEYR